MTRDPKKETVEEYVDRMIEESEDVRDKHLDGYPF